ncbi:hypothetical protein H4Q26_003055 [Puccinia striiformis f. sp. tritici PST-130]|nr:hypothetical protein H4Q26_003055 [Puccinia striiformis f. sp. tritici PST-130]
MLLEDLQNLKLLSSSQSSNSAWHCQGIGRNEKPDFKLNHIPKWHFKDLTPDFEITQQETIIKLIENYGRSASGFSTLEEWQDCEIEGLNGRFRSHKMRKGLRAAGAVGQSTALLTNQIDDNTNPRKLSERISTNQKVSIHKERTGIVDPAQPERKEPEIIAELLSRFD